MYRSQSIRAVLRGASTSVPRVPLRLFQHNILVSPWNTASIVSAKSYASLTVKVPPMAESISEGTIAQVHKAVGDRVDADEEIATIETDKIDVSATTSEGGVVTQVLVKEGDTVSVGQDLLIVELSDAEPESTSEETSASPPQTEPYTEGKTAPSPANDARSIEERSPAILSPPVSSTLAQQKPSPKPSTPMSPATSAASANPGSSAGGGRPSRNKRLEPLSRMRKTIATRLKESQNKCASLTTLQRVDMSALVSWRAKNKEAVAKAYDVRLGYMGAFAKATSLAALRVPQVNASIDTEGGFITYRDYVDISIAVSTPKGLVTPVVRDCDSKSIVEIERAVALVAQKARESKLTMADLQGGNFSISNPGIFGSMFGTPLINYPQAAVFNMNSIKDDVVAIDGRVEIRPMMYITLTYDHRLIDGREAVTFLNLVKGYIEDLSSMLL